MSDYESISIILVKSWATNLIIEREEIGIHWRVG